MSLTNSNDTPWIGNSDDKLYLQSGQFTSTIKDSEDVSGIDILPSGISWDGVNTPWCGDAADKLYLQSGQFTSTLKTSEDVNGVDNVVSGISWDGVNTLWSGAEADKLYLQSGQFTSTIKDSEDVSGVDLDVSDISYDGKNTPWCGAGGSKLYLQSGQFTSTINDSEDVSGVDTIPSGISWDGTDTPWGGNEADKLYLQSGQFTSTLKTSEDVSGVDAGVSGISTNQISLRINLEEPDPVSAVGDTVDPDVFARDGIFLLGPASTNVSSFVELFPEYDLAFPKVKDQTNNRTLSGKLFSYKFSDFNTFEIPESWVNSQNRSTINSFWEANVNLEFYTNYSTFPSSFFNVRITNKEEPYPQFVRPYFSQFYRGSLLLETYD